jgi:hypothetical protein
VVAKKTKAGYFSLPSKAIVQVWRYIVLVVITLFCKVWSIQAQELYPMTEPASNTPKDVWGLRLMEKSYNEVDRLRNLIALRVMYGITPRLSVYATPTISNHHNRELPPEFPVHNTPQIGVNHPYLFNGVNFYAKYRLVNIDGQNTHFRVAAYAEYGWLNVAHDEAEPNLLDDTKGFGGGVIATYLKNHFAATFTGGAILPAKYDGVVPDELPGLPGVAAVVKYGSGYVYDLSLGYLLLPAVYKDYKTTNWNVYLEFIGKSYSAVQMEVGNVYYGSQLYSVSTASNRALQAGNYVEAYPGIQCIIRSNVRADFSVGFPMIQRSFAHFYPVYFLSVQRYFFGRGHKTKQNA